MHFDPVDIFFQIIVLLFAICVHESAHAWMANRLGDPTAKMLGRVSLNPHRPHRSLRHHPDAADPDLFWAFRRFGWAKPTPVDSRNFKNLVRDDILTAVAGPVSNFLTAFFAVVVLAIIVHGSTCRSAAFTAARRRSRPAGHDVLWAMWINVVLAVFNLIPLPPLDGSHVIRHFLSYNALSVYDRIGYFGLMVLMFILPMIGSQHHRHADRAISMAFFQATAGSIPGILMTDTSQPKKGRILSGMRPTGKLHLGNYVGALRNWVGLQDEYDCFFFIADWHALTTDYADTRR